MEGNRGGVLSYLLEQADHVVVLDVSPLRSTNRIIKRHLQQDAQLKTAVSDGWDDNLSWQFIWFCLRIFPRNFPAQVQQILTQSKGKV